MRTAPIILLVCTVAFAGKENLLANGGFEKGLDSWIFVDNSGNTEHSLDKQVKKEGRQSLHLKKAGGPPFDVLRADVGALREGSKVSVTAWFKAEKLQSNGGWFKIFFYDRSGEVIEQGNDVKPLAGTYDWKEITIENRVPKKAASAAVFILIVQPGELWTDDVRLTGAAGAPAKEKPARKRPLDSGMRSWLDRNAIMVKTLDFDARHGDLARLKPLLEGVRIVQLGEQSHMDGASFRAKARLARFLHEEMGFEVIAFESGLFECEKANGLLAEGKGKAAMHASIFGIWRVEQVLPLFDHMAAAARSEHPLRLTGFDTRGSGAAADGFLADLYAFLAPAAEVPAADREALAAIDAKLNASPYAPTGAEREAASAALGRIRKLIDGNRAELVKAHGEPETEFFSRCVDNYGVREKFEFSMTGDDKELSGNLRDKQMAENLRWLAEVRYPDKKIITWAATAHQAHNLKLVKIGGSSEQYEHWTNMGQYVHEWYGPKVFTIAFAALEGRAGRFSPQFDIPEPKEDSFEDLLGRYGQPLVLVPLRGESAFQEAMFCSPMSYDRSIEAPWPQVVDAIFFTREMTATKWVPAD
ncbi:MAG TPA: erythromycin esterase family protein [Planctomycetota bacterium]|nr:erythromycin esterase family protein [Planctomycetota bacterium]